MCVYVCVSVCVMLWLMLTDMDAMWLSDRSTDLFHTHKKSLWSAYFISSLCEPFSHIKRIPKSFGLLTGCVGPRVRRSHPKHFPRRETVRRSAACHGLALGQHWRLSSLAPRCLALRGRCWLFSTAKPCSWSPYVVTRYMCTCPA